ncbi:replication initiation and membrane attachment family protein [Jeotgalibacillus soli]|uniref:Uncharacterized protein n=1 Tax=Jeotgalibacillus soli TaxID=889306 RepID=A0A0C2VIG8_9BACL|nr:DnaD domain protein [Jeotgalibacillus soli]KIL43803.1 hypothetical protein KP78_36270 [Jeotgalibacillus soli]
MTNMWKEVQPTDEYIVQLNGLLHEADRDVLQFLYQPLVGSSSISLYSLLWGEVERHQLESENFMHASLLSMLSTNVNQLFEARLRLEGMGLLKTFVRGTDKKEFLYQLQPPLRPNEFFEDPMLSVFLYRQVGSGQFQRLKQRYAVRFSTNDTYREVTRSFQDVYSSEALTNASMPPSAKAPNDGKILFESQNEGITTDFASFDFHLLLAGLSEAMVPRSAFTYHVKNMIAKLSILYGLNVLDMKSVVLSAVNEENTIEIDALRKAARDYYQLHRSPSLPKIQHVRITADEQMAPTIEQSNEQELLTYLESSSPVQVLKDASNGGEPTKSELAMIEELLYHQKLPAGVVNVLLQYVLLRTDMKLTKGYVEKIAAHWARKKITTAKDAMELAKNEHKQYSEWKEETNNGTKKRRTNKTIRKEKLPDWFKARQEAKNTAKPSETEKGDDLEFEEKKRKLQEKLRKRSLRQVNNDGAD